MKNWEREQSKKERRKHRSYREWAEQQMWAMSKLSDERRKRIDNMLLATAKCNAWKCIFGKCPVRETKS